MPDRFVRIDRLADPDGRRHRRPIGRPDASAVRFDDLPRDRQPEAGVLAETLARPIGVEALENALERMRRDAGAVVVDGDEDTLLAAPRPPPPSDVDSSRTLTVPPGSENEQALSMRLVTTWARRKSWPSTK